MADLQSVARAKARKYGLDPNVFVRQIRQESGFNPNARSPAGATGIAQIMPATARGWGVNPNDPVASLDAAAKNMSRYVHQFGSYEKALRAYNAGPGNVDKSKGFRETNNYVRTILGGREPPASGVRSGGSGGGAGGRGASGTRLDVTSHRIPGRTTALPGRTFETTVPTLDADAYERAKKLSIVGQLIARRNPQSILLRSGVLSTSEPSISEFMGQQTTASRVPGQTVRTPGMTALSAREVAGSGGGGSARVAAVSGSGAARALSWVTSKVGAPGSAETTENQGQLASFLNKRFGFSAAPWCAMFTSAAVTKGGAPPSARTASVAQVREKARAGDGYQGFVDPRRAREGDLVLFGNNHIGMVERNDGGRITYVGGNQSDTVSRATTTADKVDVVRPKYGARRR